MSLSSLHVNKTNEVLLNGTWQQYANIPQSMSQSQDIKSISNRQNSPEQKKKTLSYSNYSQHQNNGELIKISTYVIHCFPLSR